MSTAQITTPYIKPKPPVGLPVAWYDRGTVAPQFLIKAHVVGFSSGGDADLLIERRDGSRRTIHGVKHVDDPSLITMDHGTRAQRGCWDWIPGAPALRCDLNTQNIVDELINRVTALEAELAGMRVAVDALAKDASLDQDDIDGRIRQLLQANVEPGTIAERCRCPIQKVSAVARKLKDGG